MSSKRLLVIGGGMAGSMAALACRAKLPESKVWVVQRGWGETAMGGGIFSSFRSEDPSLGKEAADFLFQAMAQSGVPLARLEGREIQLCTEKGVRRGGEYSLRTQVRGHLGALPERVLCLGFEEYLSFVPEWTARSIHPKWISARLSSGFEVHTGCSGIELSAAAFAKEWDDAEKWPRLIGKISELCKKRGAEAIALPPLCGLDLSDPFIEELNRQTGVPCFELLGDHPSIPGIRIQRGLSRALQDQKVTLYSGSARMARVKERSVLSVGIETPRGIHEVELDFLILASGSFVSGGLRGFSFDRGKNAGVVEEPLLRLRLNAPRFYQWWNEEFAQTQTLLQTGVEVDGELAPMGEEGAILYENALVTGALLGGRFGLGDAVVTGYRAGLIAAQRMAQK